MSDPAVLHVMPHPGEGGERYVELLETMPGFAFGRVSLTEGRGKLETVPGLYRARRAARGADLIHIHGDSAALVCLPLFRRAPTVLTFNGLHLWRRVEGPGRRLAAAGLRRAISSSRRTICVSDAELADARELAGPGSADRLVLVENGIPDPGGADPSVQKAKRTELGLPSDAVVVLFAGQLEERKGVLDLLAALEAARRERPKLIGLIAGDGPLREEVERRADRADRVLGRRGDVPGLLAAADVFALPSEREGLSIAVLEAMAAGVAVVVSDGPGNPEAVGDAGLVTPYGDPGALSAALVRLASEPELRERLGRAARDRFVERFTAERMVEETRRVYEEALRPQPA